MSDVAVSFDGRDTPQAFLDMLAAAEAGCARTIWLANHLFQRDPISLAALALARTQRVRVGLMAMSPLTVHPVQMAMAAATLDELFPGRVVLCIGMGAPVDLASVGLAADKPLRLMREALDLLRRLFAGETVQAAGEHFCVTNRALAAGERRVPIVLAASGPQMLELAGAQADGVLISAGASVEFVRWTLEHVRRGAGQRHVTTHALVYSAVDDGAVAAHDRLRRTLAILLRGAHHRKNLDLAGSVLDQDALNRAMSGGDWPAAEALITDAIVQRHAASGTPAAVRERFAAYHEAGIDEIVVAGARGAAQVTPIMAAMRGEESR